MRVDLLIEKIDLELGLIVPPTPTDSLLVARLAPDWGGPPPPPPPAPPARQRLPEHLTAKVRALAERIDSAHITDFATAVDRYLELRPQLLTLKARYKQYHEDRVPTIPELAAWAEEFEQPRAVFTAIDELGAAAQRLVAALRQPLCAEAEQHESAMAAIRTQITGLRKELTAEHEQAMAARGLASALQGHLDADLLIDSFDVLPHAVTTYRRKVA
jgi:hypothetical protein